ncbi:hypothetical protein [Enterobacter hormaechei]|uniref:hypothetical protein n=1 Tax=Enterobacter hormaechei TaxID=158836 RepID=UPI002E2D02FC|nr:hypothetical protein [Enterobacter hormaechei]MED5716431.1 hypothetical protein [Enterobacter hormaechei]
MKLFDTDNYRFILWRKFLPWLIQNGAQKNDPHDYFLVYVRDTENTRYILKKHEGRNVVLCPMHKREDVSVSVKDISEMQAEIIHYKRNGFQAYKGIIPFAFDHYTKIITLKTGLARLKGRCISGLKADTETISRDRYNLLRLLVTDYVNQRPSRVSSGFTQREVIAMLYGTLWYKHIKNESFSRKISLLLESLVLTGDLSEEGKVYYVQGQAITTMVEYEKENQRVTHQQKMQKKITRFMFTITLSTLLIILVLLSMAGVVDLAAVWQKILQIKPLRFLMNFI